MRQNSTQTFAQVAVVLLCIARVSFQPEAAANELKLEIVPTAGNSDTVNSVAFSPDGRTIVSGGLDNAVKLWNVATGRELRTLTGHKESVRAVAFSPDGAVVASASWDKTVKLWDAANGRELRTLTGHSQWVHAVAFSPDGRTLASASADNTVKLWDAASGRALRTLTGHKISVYAVAFSPDGRTLVSGGGDKTLQLWDVASGRALRTLPGHNNSVCAVGFSPDGRTIVSGSWDNTLRLWDRETGWLLHVLAGHTNWVCAVGFTKDGHTVVSGSNDTTLRLWDVTSGRERRTLSGHKEQVYTLAIAPDGDTIISSGVDQTIKVWDLASGRELHIFAQRRPYVTAIAFSPDRRIIASCVEDWLVLWDAAIAREMHLLAGSGASCTKVAFSPDGRTVASGSRNNSLKLWDVTTGRELLSFAGHGAVPTTVAFSPDGRTLVSGSADKTVRLWDVASGRSLRTLAGHRESVNSVAFAPDGRTVASGANDGTIRLWDVASGRALRTIVADRYFVHGVAFSPDGRLVVSADHDNTIKLWDVASGRELRSLEGHIDSVYAVAFSPDGRSVVSGSRDLAIKLWDPSIGHALRTFVGHQSMVFSVAFSPDGTTVVSGSRDTTIRRWSIRGELLSTSIVGPDGEWLTITPEGFFDASNNGAEILSAVRGMEVFSIHQLYQSLYRPDLVREKLAGDPRGLVREAAARLDLAKVLASGNAPTVALVSPRDGSRGGGEQVTAEVEIAEKGGGIGRIEWRVNGVTVAVENMPAQAAAGQPLRLTRGLALDEGDNEIEVVAYNSQNLVASLPARAHVSGEAPAGRPQPRLYVLAVGVNDYADADLRLSYALPDAQALAEALGKASKGLYENVEVTLVEDANVSGERLAAAFNHLAGKVRPNDVFAFFVAGHGKTIDGRYYFIPQDFRRSGTAITTRDVQSRGIAQEQWQAWFAGIPAHKSVLIFDTCESGTLTRESRETELLARGAASDRLAQATGRTILTASSGDADALEGYRGHGLFTYNLLEALERADGDGNGTIEVAELATYVYANVTALSAKVLKERQQPQIRIAANYPLVKPTRVLDDAAPGIVIPQKPTHQIANPTELLVVPALGARRVRKLDASTPVTLVNSEAGWTLIARDAKVLGYVASRDLAPLQ
jgi:WD40 repeat protein/uncharacterized caspase-like protein